jgi:hypothetical protein
MFNLVVRKETSRLLKVNAGVEDFPAIHWDKDW